MTKKPTDKKETIKNNRNAIDGEFTSDSYVKKHQDTTTVEHNPKPKPKPKGK